MKEKYGATNYDVSPANYATEVLLHGKFSWEYTKCTSPVNTKVPYRHRVMEVKNPDGSYALLLDGKCILPSVEGCMRSFDDREDFILVKRNDVPVLINLDNLYPEQVSLYKESIGLYANMRERMGQDITPEEDRVFRAAISVWNDIETQIKKVGFHGKPGATAPLAAQLLRDMKERP